jgi:hypothetical protein
MCSTISFNVINIIMSVIIKFLKIPSLLSIGLKNLNGLF